MKNLVFCGSVWNGLPLSMMNTSQYFEIALQGLDDFCRNYIERHSKVFAFRMTIRYPEQRFYACSKNNKIFVDAFREFRWALCQKKLDVEYFWCREQDTSLHPHYHVLVLVNGHLSQNAYGHRTLMEEEWAKVLNIPHALGLVHLDKYNNFYYNFEKGVMIERNSPDFEQQYKALFSWGSYLTKTHTKNRAPKHVREMQFSDYKDNRQKNKDHFRNYMNRKKY